MQKEPDECPFFFLTGDLKKNLYDYFLEVKYLLDKFASSVVMHTFRRPNLILLLFFLLLSNKHRASILYENVYPNMLTLIDLWRVQVKRF